MSTGHIPTEDDHGRKDEDASQILSGIQRRWYYRRKSLRFRLAHRLSLLTGGRIRSPGFYRAVDFHRDQDTKDLEKERIAPNEHVRTWCLWAVDFYTPDNISSFYAALDHLEQAGFESEERTPANWLRKNRTNPGSSMELYLAPRGKRGWGTGYYCVLPRFSEAAQSLF